MYETPEVLGTDHDGSHPAGRTEVVDAAVRAAADLFAEKNPSQVSVREIAARAGVSHALVHRYLGSKEDILRAALALGREESAEYWMAQHGSGHSECIFEQDQPPGRYVRTVMRAALDGIPLRAQDLRLPHADRMLGFLQSSRIPGTDDAVQFDASVLFSAALAMSAGMAVAEEFFLAQSGLEDADRARIRAEMNRLVAHIMTLSDRAEDA